MPLTESQTRYVNFYTDFAFKSEEELAKYTPQERQDYEESLKTFRDWYSVIKTAENKGLEKGRKEGREEGREEERVKAYDEKLESARNLINNGVPSDIVKRSLNLSDSDISKL